MQKKSLTGTIRKEFKKNASRRLRRDGKIPAIIYGHQEPVSIAVDAHEFSTKFKMLSENIIINIDVDGTQYDVLIKDYQENLVKGEIEHLDFFEIEKGKTLKTHVHVHITGTASGVKAGGVFEWLLHELEIECMPKDLPETVNIDVTELTIGKSIHVEDLNLGEGIKVLNSPHQVICHVIMKREETGTEEEDDEAGESMEGSEE